MREISHVAQLQGALASLIGQRPSPSNSIEPSRDAREWPDTVAMDWLRLRAMVDALLRRATASKDAGGAIAATRTTSQPQEAHHG